MYIEYAQKFLLEEGKSKFGFALMRKLTDGNKILISDAEHFKPGLRIQLQINV